MGKKILGELRALALYETAMLAIGAAARSAGDTITHSEALGIIERQLTIAQGAYLEIGGTHIPAVSDD